MRTKRKATEVVVVSKANGNAAHGNVQTKNTYCDIIRQEVNAQVIFLRAVF